MRRLLALAVAAAMVGGSLWLRSRGDDDGGGGGGGSVASGPLRLTCATELEAVCEALRGDDVEVTVEAAPETADRLTTADRADLDGWLVPGPWPDIVAGARERAARPPLLEPAGAPLARSRIALVILEDRASRLRDECGGEVSWRCLGDVAQRPWTELGGEEAWREVKLGHGDLDTDATALLVLGQAVAAYFDDADLSSDRLDDEGFQAWFHRLEEAVRLPGDGAGLEAIVTQQGRYDAVGTVEAVAAPLARSARGDTLQLLYPSPMATADVVLATVGAGRRAGRLADLVGAGDALDALRGAGWTVPGQPGGRLPSAGFLEALRERWHQEVRQ